MTWQPEARAILAQRAIERNTAIEIPCRYCHAAAGDECQVPRTGGPIVNQAAHMARLQDAGIV